MCFNNLSVKMGGFFMPVCEKKNPSSVIPDGFNYRFGLRLFLASKNLFLPYKPKKTTPLKLA